MGTKHGFWLLTATAVVMCSCLPGLAHGEFIHARVSFEQGGGLIRGTSDAEWSYATLNTLVLQGDTLWADKQSTIEVEFSGGAFLRMADGSKAEVAELGKAILVNAWTGSFYVQRLQRSSGLFHVQTPACRVEVKPDAMVRIDITGNGGTTVSVRWGEARIHTDVGAPMLVVAGKRCFIDPGLLASVPQAFDRTLEDAFDLWNRERAQMLALGNDAFPAPVAVTEAPVGYADLTPYGEWVYVDRQYYWRPTVVVDYVPYRVGHWSYIPSCGYTWVGTYPFCYVTSHYGRWMHHGSYGWIWTYNDCWGPAWVATVRYGPNFVWCPLDPWDRPVVIGSATFTIGDVRFSIGASTYCATNILYLGPQPVYPCTATIITGVPRAEINIWNIYAPSYPGPRPSYIPSSHLVRDYSPRRVIRGVDAIGPSAVRASSRSVELESGLGRSAFGTVNRTGNRSVRTPLTPSYRNAQVRDVSLAPSIREAGATSVVRSSAFEGDAARSARVRSPETAASAPAATDTPRESVRNLETVSRPQASSRTENVSGRTLRQAPEPSATQVRTETPDRGDRGGGAESPSVSAPSVERTERTHGDSPASGTRTSIRTMPSSRATQTVPDSPSLRSAPSTSVTRTPTHNRTYSERTETPQVTAPSVRTVPQTRTLPTPIAPNRSVAPRVVAPTVRTMPTAPVITSRPSVRSMPSAPQTPSVPQVRSMPSPSPSMSRPSLSAPSSPRSMPSPSVSAPSQPRSMSSPSRSMSSPSLRMPSQPRSMPSTSAGSSVRGRSR